MLTAPQKIAANLGILRSRIAAAESGCGRRPGSVTLLAVGKGHPVACLETAAQLGMRDFGENYLQEALPKIQQLAPLGLTWHFIGQLQANKTRAVAENFDWVHTVDRLRIAQRLATQRPEHLPPLQVCVQVHLGGETSKGGILPGEVPGFLQELSGLPRLQIRGLMCLPPPEEAADAQRRWFEELQRLASGLRGRFPGLDTLSMGMSGDLEAAIAAGSTLVRVGTALFGPRGTAAEQTGE
jgi:pyridoxal phosphate enzyme (YggS family)